jgi:hypothetical protein
MTEGDSTYDPKQENLKLQYELAQTQARRTIWQPRYEQFTSTWTQRTIRGSDSPDVPRVIEHQSPHYDWMTRENLGDYLLFRLDMIEKEGGTEHEKQWQDQAAAARGRLYQSGERTLSIRVSTLEPEVTSWGHGIWTDYKQVERSLAGTFPASAELTPQQGQLLGTLKRRADRYNDPRWQRWTRKARAASPATHPKQTKP